MNPSEAKTKLENLIALRRIELEALELSLGVFNETFVPDITAIAEAQAEADRMRDDANITKVENESLKAELSNKNTQIVGLETEIETKNSRIAELESESEALKNPVDDGIEIPA